MPASDAGLVATEPSVCEHKEDAVRRWWAFYGSPIGKKVMVAATGGLMLAFLVGHVAGNLKVFLPNPEPGVPDIDAYAEFLRAIGEPILPHGAVLWILRVVLVLIVTLHVICVIQLSTQNRAARPVAYRVASRVPTPWAARWMMVTGLVVLGFIVFHLLHFTTGTIEPSRFQAGAVYANLSAAFTRWPFVLLYLTGMGAIGVHVFHGAWSMSQSFGLDNPDRNRFLRRLAAVLAVALFVGFVTVPLSFAFGVMEAPEVLMEAQP